MVMAMGTLGAVLLVRFVMTKSSTGTRTFAAAAIGPGFILFPAIGFVSYNDGGVFDGIVSLVIVFLLLFALIGYPISHFATRRLDKLTQINADTFK